MATSLSAVADLMGGRAPEIDIEGLDHDGRYLWVTGSHSLKREKPDAEQGVKSAHKSLARVASGGELSRVMLAVKVLDAEDTMALMKSITPDRIQQEFEETGSGDFGRIGDDVRESVRRVEQVVGGFFRFRRGSGRDIFTL